jgi:hypothetical protein
MRHKHWSVVVLLIKMAPGLGLSCISKTIVLLLRNGKVIGGKRTIPVSLLLL